MPQIVLTTEHLKEMIDLLNKPPKEVVFYCYPSVWKHLQIRPKVFQRFIIYLASQRVKKVVLYDMIK
jgi:hypothetical protein